MYLCIHSRNEIDRSIDPGIHGFALQCRAWHGMAWCSFVSLLLLLWEYMCCAKGELNGGRGRGGGGGLQVKVEVG